MEFIQKYGKIDSDSERKELIDGDEVTVSDQEFIGDVSIFQDQDPLDYNGLKNVTREL